MGGLGSGGWNDTGRRTTSDAWRLSVDSLNKAGVLTCEWPRGWQWSRDGERVAYIGICATETGITLDYRSRWRGGEWTDHKEHIAISWEACRFGGRRPYFHCPVCGRRVLHLHGISRYLCRKCNNLSYPSQRESPVDRAFRRANGIRHRLDGEPGTANAFPMKPKHMHWRTYNRLEWEYYREVEAINQYCISRFGWEL